METVILREKTKEQIVTAYRFTTKISAQGTIQIPYSPSLFEEEVEVVILPKSKPQEGKIKAMEFVEKWKGFLVKNDAKV